MATTDKTVPPATMPQHKRMALGEKVDGKTAPAPVPAKEVISKKNQ